MFSRFGRDFYFILILILMGFYSFCKFNHIFGEFVRLSSCWSFNTICICFWFSDNFWFEKNCNSFLQFSNANFFLIFHWFYNFEKLSWSIYSLLIFYVPANFVLPGFTDFLLLVLNRISQHFIENYLEFWILLFQFFLGINFMFISCYHF